MKRTRRGARVVLLRKGRFLLLHFVYTDGPLAGTDYWGLPGGGIEPGESPAQAAVRELREETGITIPEPSASAAVISYAFRLSSGEDVLQEDTLFLSEAPEGASPGRGGLTPEETASLQEYRWWTLAETAASRENIIPADLAAVLKRAGMRS